MVESSLQTALRAGPRAAGRWLLSGDLGSLRCVTALATVGLPWLLVRLWKKRKHAMMLQQRQAEETVGQRSTATVGRIDGTNGRVLTSTRQSESMRRDCLLRHEASERLSSGRREQVRADEAPVTELAAQLNSLENETKGGAPHEPSAAATNGAVPMEHVPVRRVDTFGASIDVARMSASAGNGRKASPLSHGVPGAAASPPPMQRVDTFGESLETSSAAAERARCAAAGGAAAGGAAAGGAAVGQGASLALQERLAMKRKASPLVRGVGSSPLGRSPLAGS